MLINFIIILAWPRLPILMWVIDVVTAKPHSSYPREAIERRGDAKLQRPRQAYY